MSINSVDEFKTNRSYPDYTSSVPIDVLKKQYTDNIEKSKELNKNLKRDKENNIRIMTYNVHFWTDVNENNSLHKILGDIKEINPDILCLNEVTLGKTKYNDEDIPELFEKLMYNGLNLIESYENYELLSFCNITPSWYNTVYGNAVFIKKKIRKLIQKEFLNKPKEPYSKICGMGNECTMGQYNHVYDDLNCCKEGSSEKFTNGKETRCFIKFSLPNFDIICTHLEANDTNKRKLELQEIDKHISRTTIILGDFNMISEKDYIQEVKNKWIDNEHYQKFKDTALGRQTIDDLGWKEIKNLDKINMTVWNGTRVDYIFYKNIIKYPTFYREIVNLNLTDRTYKQYNYFFDNYDMLIGYLETDSYDVLTMRREFMDFKAKSRTKDEKESFIRKHWDNIEKIYRECKNDDITNHIRDSGVYFTSSSDHLPLYVDIGYTFRSLVTPELKEIEGSDAFLSNGYIELTAEDFIKYWNIMNTTIYDINDFYIYNGQPSDSYSWVNHLNEFNGFVDPYNFGTTKGSNALGNLGLYGASNPQRAILWANGFVTDGITSGKIAK
jgi:endonuclease/exonuclease/phosphatase family metal-dependent hydrolase